MAHHKRILKITLRFLGALVLVVAIAALSLFFDIRRGACESGGQLLGPTSNDGYSASGVSQSGACLISFVTLQQRDVKVSHVVCSNDATIASCETLRREVSPGWSDFFGTRCTSVSFIGGTDCTCTKTGEGCQKGDWPLEITP